MVVYENFNFTKNSALRNFKINLFKLIELT